MRAQNSEPRGIKGLSSSDLPETDEAVSLSEELGGLLGSASEGFNVLRVVECKLWSCKRIETCELPVL